MVVVVVMVYVVIVVIVEIDTPAPCNRNGCTKLRAEPDVMNMSCIGYHASA